MEQIKKGTKVMVFSERDLTHILRENKVKYKKVLYAINIKVVKAVMYECFVSGDGPEGLSVVALDNPSFCAYRFNPKRHAIDQEYQEERKQIKNGYLDMGITYSPEPFGGLPSCPYA